MTIAHHLNWTFEKGMARVTAELACTSSKDELCRSKPGPGCQCDEMLGIGQDEKGWFHVVYRDELSFEIAEKHYHVPADECNIEMWMNEDPTETILETYQGKQYSIPVGTLDVDLTWTGDEWGWAVTGVDTDG